MKQRATKIFESGLVSSEISDLCEISYLLLLACCFTSQKKSLTITFLMCIA